MMYEINVGDILVSREKTFYKYVVTDVNEDNVYISYFNDYGTLSKFMSPYTPDEIRRALRPLTKLEKALK